MFCRTASSNVCRHSLCYTVHRATQITLSSSLLSPLYVMWLVSSIWILPVLADQTIRHPDHAGGLVLASTQAKLDVERSIVEFRRLGGEEAQIAAREFLTVRVDAESSKAFAEKCMSLYNTTPQPPRDTVIFRPKLAMAFHSLEGTWHRTWTLV